VYPLRLRETGKRIPVVIVVTAVLFNVLNAYVNARWISQFGSYPDEWLATTPFLAGITIFAGGWLINQRADRVLIGLRKPGDSHYSIPRGGMYRFVSCPNYFGEILQWTGWAVMTWSLAGLAFAVFTAANLLPRALATHRWYRERFPDYPASRRAVIPFLV
jgi:protein-S-isoprenylcysteine O-methyltransferase Ste14